jgi:hypothetical protein
VLVRWAFWNRQRTDESEPGNPEAALPSEALVACLIAWPKSTPSSRGLCFLPPWHPEPPPFGVRCWLVPGSGVDFPSPR